MTLLPAAVFALLAASPASEPSGAGRPSIHAGDQTHFPRESSELVGFYEIRYQDGLALTHEIRYDETVGRWDAGPILLGVTAVEKPRVEDLR